IRMETSNGVATASIPALSPVRISTQANGCTRTNTTPPSVPPTTCRALDLTEGSKDSIAQPSSNPGWSNTSLVAYNGFIRNDRTGARTLTMPFVGPGVGMNQIIRRPPAGEDPASVVGQSRLYNQADIRILLASSEAELVEGTGIPVGDIGNIE